jgi:Icc protein
MVHDMYPTKPIRIMQISDIHLCANTTRELLGVNTDESFRAVLDLIAQAKHKPDLFILSGDLSQDGSAESYIKLADLMKKFDISAYYLNGNHDNQIVLDEIYPRETIVNDKQIVMPDWQVILLNSQMPGKVPGYLDQSQLHYLETCLQAHPEHRAIVFFHHQPVKVGSAWLDNLGVQNADEFWAVAMRYPALQHVFFGHVHQEHEEQVGHIICRSLPSTCIQFKPNQDEFELDHLPPGYRWIELHADGRLTTGIQRVPHYIGVFDVNAKGY